MSERIKNLNEIYSLVEAGAGFYRDAKDKIENVELEGIFREHAVLYEEAAQELRTCINAAGGELAKASLLDKWRETYANLMTTLGDTHDRLIASLEEHEDRTLAAYRNALAHADNAEDREMLQSQFNSFEKTHRKMRALKHPA